MNLAAAATCALVVAALFVGWQGPSTSPDGVHLVAPVSSPADAARAPAGTVSHKATIGFATFASREGPTSWMIVQGTGNCCENYVISTPSGQLVDAGAGAPVYSDDGGTTWMRVELPLWDAGSEGAVAYAPGGDIVGASWSPYQADRLVSFRYSSATDHWETAEQVLKTPFFDRPWIGVFEGPFTIGPLSGPYLVVLKGGLYKDVYYYSVDGLTYLLASAPDLASLLAGASEAPIHAGVASERDQVQTPASAGFSSAGPGFGLSRRTNDEGPFVTCRWTRIDSSGRWSCYDTPSSLTGEEGQQIVVDSEGRVWHLLWVDEGSSVRLRWSTDGGATWGAMVETRLPAGHTIEEVDLKVNAGAGIAAVAVHAHTKRGPDQDLVLKYTTSPPRLSNVIRVGAGDLEFGRGIGATGPRFDLTSLAILPTGKLVVSFGDRAHDAPALAIER